ncbi:protein GOLM2 isoform X1 [Bombina bombina]|uniref:protein GOLM2 isoform X1 n=1 Tax=Bombina bombina TaxID=8345 RepID=UPI00235AA585|nr:protein GOLM2 isoform X1 [Bombina bombina]
MVGFGAPRRTGRMPPFVLLALLAVIGLLAFNYWNVSARQAALHEELLGLQAQVQRTEVARSRLEKRNSDLMVQAEKHQTLLEQRQGEYQSMGKRLQALDMKAQHCELERLGLKTNVSHQMEDISRLKEKLAELRQEFIRKEDQLHTYQNNITLLQDESQQCRQQLADQKREFEEIIRKPQLEQKVETVQTSSKEVIGEAGTENKLQNVIVEKNEGKPEDLSNNHLKFEKDTVKIGNDAGMPEIEDSEPAKENILPTAEKKLVLRAFENKAEDQGSQKRPSMQPNSNTEADANHIMPAAKKDSVLPLGMDNSLHLKPLPPKQIPGEPKAMGFPNLKQSRFFDENESPVDPQHGSKVADYNGDDGNVGEYEADKQADLAYNEEEDGDGGEEDVQEDDDRDGQGDAAEYRKDRFDETL